MPIKNPDGTTYKLYGSNKLMDEQKHWNKSELTFHNFNWKPIVFQDSSQPIKVAPFLLGPPPEVVKPVEKLPEKPPEAPQPLPPVIEPVVMPKVPETGFVGLRCHCLPAIVTQEVDELFAKNKKTIQYGNPFVHKVMPVTMGDILAAFDTDDEKVTIGSILYPKTYEKRWWRVASIGKHQDGIFTLYCELSDQQPYFSSS